MGGVGAGDFWENLRLGHRVFMNNSGLGVHCEDWEGLKTMSKVRVEVSGT